jgi:uncharacterized membrane protein
MKPTRASSNRLHYLDWVRGVGAIVMLQGHAFDSFLKPDLRPGGAYTLSQFVGGMPPAIFLFLTGVTLAFLMDSTERKGLPPRERFLTALGRSRYLFLLAFAFRLQSFICGFSAAWQGLFRVDVLNCMGFAMALMAVTTLARTRDRAWISAAVGSAVFFASPLVSQLGWSRVPFLVRDYIAPGYGSFSFFPWGGYLAFGVGMGSLIRMVREDAAHRLMQGTAVAGGALVLAGQYFAGARYTLYAKSDFWLNSPAQTLTKLGVTLLLVVAAFVWTRYGSSGGWSWVRQFGITSLLVYWVHIELIYGHELWFLKGNLTVPQTVAAAVALVLLMLALSTAKTYWHRVRAVLGELGWEFGPRPERIPAD